MTATPVELLGLVTLVTGASRGLGKAICLDLAASGAHVAMFARDKSTLAEAAQEVSRACAEDTQRVIAIEGDVGVAGDVERATRSTEEQLGPLDLLVCNAGVYGPLGRLEDVAWAEWEEAVSVNLFGVVHCMRAVLPGMRSRRKGKIVVLSGGGATAPLPRITAYAASKAAVVRLVESLALEVQDDGIDINAIAPGALDTRLLDQVLAAGPDIVGAEFHRRMVEEKEKGGTPLEVGARLVRFLASPASDRISGRLLSAVWDKWDDLPNHLERLVASDVYTLRRIMPEDRGWT